jgi:hypothetical protein
VAPDVANHAIRDGNYPIVYIAANGGLYKYFPDSGEIHLMKAIEATDQGYMVGYAGLTKLPVITGILELVVMPILPTGGITSDQDWIRHFVPGDGWLKKTPPAAGQIWKDINISKLNPNNWLAYVGHPQYKPWGEQNIFVSNTNGASWTRVEMEEADDASKQVTIYHAGWSPHAADTLWIAARAEPPGAGGVADAWYGNPFTGPLTRIPLISGSNAQWYGAAIAENGDYILRGRKTNSVYENYYVPPGGPGVFTGSQPPHGFQQITALIGTNNILGVAGVDHTLYKAEHYNLGAMETTGTDLADESTFGAPQNGHRGYLEVLTGMRYFHARSHDQTAGIVEITNPFASPSVLPSYGQGFPVGSVRADMQSRTTLAAMSKRSTQTTGQALFYIFSGGAWSEMAGPEDGNPHGMSEFALEPIVRAE